MGTSTPDFVGHASDVLSVLVQISKSKNIAEDHTHLCSFLIGRCWAQVQLRIAASDHLLNFPESANLVTVLDGWQLQPWDPLSDEGTLEVTTEPQLTTLLAQANIPFESSPHGTYFRLSTHTAGVWIRVLCMTLHQYFEAAREYAQNRGKPALECMAKQMIVLAALVNHSAIKSIFALPSFEEHLKGFAKTPSGRGNIKPREFLHDPHQFAKLLGEHCYTCWFNSHYLLASLEDELQLNEKPPDQILRYLRSVTQWYTAAISLSKWIVRSSEKPMLHAIYIPAPHWEVPDPMEQAQYQQDARAHIMEWVCLELNMPFSDKEWSIMTTTLEEFFESCPIISTSELSHTVHRDALAMGLLNNARYPAAEASSHWVLRVSEAFLCFIAIIRRSYISV